MAKEGFRAIRSCLLRRVGFGVGLCLGSCDTPNDDRADDQSGSGSSEGAETDECLDGEIGCPCVDGGLCSDGLACVGNVCEPVESSTGGVDGEGSGEDDSGGGGVDACEADSDCHETEICAFDAWTPATDFIWEFAVDRYVPGGCADGWGSAEVFYVYVEGGVEVDSSDSSSCPAMWPTVVHEYDPESTFELEFWELDAFFDDYYTSLCWEDPVSGEPCSVVPTEVLRSRDFVGMSDDGVHEFRVSFQPVLD